MSDYKGNFHSTAYAPMQVIETFAGLVKTHVVTAAEVTATKVALTTEGIAGTASTDIVMAIVYRANVALPTQYTLEYNTTDGLIYLKGNGSYTLTANDVIVYIVAPNPSLY